MSFWHGEPIEVALRKAHLAYFQFVLHCEPIEVALRKAHLAYFQFVLHCLH